MSRMLPLVVLLVACDPEALTGMVPPDAAPTGPVVDPAPPAGEACPAASPSEDPRESGAHPGVPCGPGVLCVGGEGAFASIQVAIDAAEDGDLVLVAAGVYAERVTVEGVSLHVLGGFAADFGERDVRRHPTRIEAPGGGAAVSLVQAGETLFEGFEVTGGTGDLRDLPWYVSGGGFYIEGGAPTVASNLVEGNSCLSDDDSVEATGGGIYAEDADATLRHNLVRDNVSGTGGGISVEGGRVSIIANAVTDNRGVSDHGGGLYLAAPSLDVTGNLVRGNEIGRALGYGWGGGIIVFGEGSEARLSWNVVTGNSAPSVGSGTYIDDGARAVITSELLYDNDCGVEARGAALYVDGLYEVGSHVTADRLTIDDACGAVFVEGNSTLTLSRLVTTAPITLDDTSEVTVRDSVLSDAFAGDGNEVARPAFADPASGDYHLRSRAGRCDPTGVWVEDDASSPGIGAGAYAESDQASRPDSQ